MKKPTERCLDLGLVKHPRRTLLSRLGLVQIQVWQVLFCNKSRLEWGSPRTLPSRSSFHRYLLFVSFAKAPFLRVLESMFEFSAPSSYLFHCWIVFEVEARAIWALCSSSWASLWDLGQMTWSQELLLLNADAPTKISTLRFRSKLFQKFDFGLKVSLYPASLSKK